MMTCPISLVAAIAENGVIGRDNALAWRLKSDLKRFRAITWGNPIIMGRKTFASIGRPLPGRETLVMSRDPAFAAPGVHVVHDWPAAKRLAGALASKMNAREVAVVGGAQVYALALPDADVLHLTVVHSSPPGDVLFPWYDSAEFRETASDAHPAGPEDEHAFTFVDLMRRAEGSKA